MALIVQKFGGTSVADLDKIRHVADRVQAEVNRGNKVVVSKYIYVQLNSANSSIGFYYSVLSKSSFYSIGGEDRNGIHAVGKFDVVETTVLRFG